MIVCPGGGYSYTVVDKEGSEIAAWLNSAGISALVLKYRTPNNREGALQDVQRALSLVRARASEWNIDPQRVGVIGFSAGGNLAAKASNLFDARAYAAIDEVDRQSCRPDFVLRGIVADLEAAVVEVARQRVPAPTGIADGLGEIAPARDFRELGVEPDGQLVDFRFCRSLSDRAPDIRRGAGDCSFDIE